MEMLQVETMLARMSAFCVPRHGPATDRQLVVGLFFLLLLHVGIGSGGDGDESINTTYMHARPAQLLGLDSGPAFYLR